MSCAFGAQDICGVAGLEADSLEMKAVEHACNNDSSLGRGYGIAVVEKALKALEYCRRENCPLHANEWFAIRSLQKLVDEADELDAQFEEERAARAAE